jgi:putative colanic acid biosynthesis acetyltransferase WcaF
MLPRFRTDYETLDSPPVFMHLPKASSRWDHANMAKQLHYHAAEHIAQRKDPLVRPSFPLGIRVRRLLWNLCWAIFYRLSPRPLHGWRSMVLRLFGARGPNCHFYPSARVWAPWNLDSADHVTAGDGAEIYNPAPVHVGSHAILSQCAYVCGATHDFEDPAFPLLAFATEIGPYAWICARACVAPGINVGEGAVLGLASVATRDLEPWGVYAGAPAKKVKERTRIRPWMGMP